MWAQWTPPQADAGIGLLKTVSSSNKIADEGFLARFNLILNCLLQVFVCSDLFVSYRSAEQLPRGDTLLLECGRR